MNNEQVQKQLEIVSPKTNALNLEPTTPQRVQDEVKRANEKLNARSAEINKEHKIRKEKESRELVGLQDRRRHAACLGLEVLAKRLRRDGKNEQAEKVENGLKFCRGHLDDISQAQLEQAKGYDKPLDALAAKTAKALAKLLPAGTFADDAEATAWAIQHLPLTGARIEQNRNLDLFCKIEKRISKANSSFWQIFEAAVMSGTMSPSDAERKKIVDLGADRLAD